MLRELKRSDWLAILGIPAERIPVALILRGTRNLRKNYDLHRRRFDNVLEVGSPNGLLEDVLIGEFCGRHVAYASVYGAAMASEVTHLFGVLGTKLVVQTGCCGVWKRGAQAGDLFIPTRAGCGEGAAQYYVSTTRVVAPSLLLDDADVLSPDVPVAQHRGGIFTTSALFAEGRQELSQWAAEGWDAVDLETAATFAVAEHFGMNSAAILFAFDNPRDDGDIIHNESEKDARRTRGNEAMIEAAFRVVERYGRI